MASVYIINPTKGMNEQALKHLTASEEDISEDAKAFLAYVLVKPDSR